MTTYLWFTDLFRLNGPLYIKDIEFRRKLSQNTMRLPWKAFVQATLRYNGLW